MFRKLKDFFYKTYYQLLWYKARIETKWFIWNYRRKNTPPPDYDPFDFDEPWDLQDTKIRQLRKENKGLEKKRRINDPLVACICLSCKSTNLSLVDLAAREITFICNDCKTIAHKRRRGSRTTINLPDGNTITATIGCPRCSNSAIHEYTDSLHECDSCNYLFPRGESIQPNEPQVEGI